MNTPHRMVNPTGLSPAQGFSHAVIPANGKTIVLGGQTAQDPSGEIVGETVVEQFDRALANLASVLTACDARPEHLVQLVVYTTDAAQYRENLRALGKVYQCHLGKHYPAMALFEVAGLFDPNALVEVLGTAVVPE